MNSSKVVKAIRGLSEGEILEKIREEKRKLAELNKKDIQALINLLCDDIRSEKLNTALVTAISKRETLDITRALEAVLAIEDKDSTVKFIKDAVVGFLLDATLK